jgi:hypothetical protein
LTLKTGAKVEGKLVRMDAFQVTLELEDGTIRSLGRDGDVPRAKVNNPLQSHIEMLPQLTDQNMHDVTAYLVTIKLQFGLDWCALDHGVRRCGRRAGAVCATVDGEADCGWRGDG